MSEGHTGIDGETRITGLIGDPVAHSRSPAILNAAYRETGLNWIYAAFPVPRGRGGDAVRGALSLRFAGLTVTMPHKAEAAGACDDLTPDAIALGGAGARVTVAARRIDAAQAAAGLVPGGHAVALADVDPGVYALVVNATPLGMQGESGPVPVERLNPGQLVVDTVYHPMETPFLAAARARGIHAVNGLGMLVHQAALAFESWTGVDAPVAVMRQAAARDPRAA